MRALKGDLEQVPASTFSKEKWFDGTYAKETDKYITHNFGYRPNLVRMDNQIAFSLFGETRAKNVIVGKEQYLYEKNYIDAYTGRDFIGEDIINDKVGKFKLIQDSLAAKDKHLLVILAAGKASFFPEYIPDSLMIETDTTNYHFFRDELKEQQVNHIDFNDWFMKNKGKMPYPLYPKTGIHWSEYGMLLAADSIIHRVGDFNAKWDLGELYFEGIDYVDEIRRIDNDIEQALNLIYKFPNYKMAYPHVRYDTKGKDSINVIVISDSFFWGMYGVGVMPKVFTDGQFWYYNYCSYPKHFSSHTEIAHLNLNEEIENADVIIMMSTEGNLYKFPWGADDMLYEFFKGNYNFDEHAYRNREIDKMEKTIRSNKKWVKDLKGKAEVFNISLDSMIRKDASYMIDEQLKKKELPTKGQLLH